MTEVRIDGDEYHKLRRKAEQYDALEQRLQREQRWQMEMMREGGCRAIWITKDGLRCFDHTPPVDVRKKEEIIRPLPPGLGPGFAVDCEGAVMGLKDKNFRRYKIVRHEGRDQTPVFEEI